MPAAATSAASAALAALPALTALTRHLTLLSARLHAGAKLASGRGRGSCGASRCFHGARTNIAVPRAPFLIPIVLTTIAIASITTIPATAVTSTSFWASLSASAIAVTAALTAIGPARLPGMLPPPVATPVATAARAVC